MRKIYTSNVDATRLLPNLIKAPHNRFANLTNLQQYYQLELWCHNEDFVLDHLSYIEQFEFFQFMTVIIF